MSTHSLLVRYQGGYFVRTVAGGSGPGGRRYLELGQVESFGVAVAIADLELARLKDPADGITATPNPRIDAPTAQRPYLRWREGDYVTIPGRSGAPSAVRALSLQVQQDDATGEVDVTPTLATRLEEDEIRLKRIIDRRLSGALAGKSNQTGSAQPAPSVRLRRPTIETQTFNWSGQVNQNIDEVNGPTQFELDGRLATIRYAWRTPPQTANAWVDTYRDGQLWFTHEIAGGVPTFEKQFAAHPVTRQDRFDMVVTSVDSFAEGLTAEWSVVYYT